MAGPDKKRQTKLAAGIQAILFDKDGTLFDFHSTWLPLLREAACLAARGDEALIPKLMALGGHDALSGRIVSGSVLAAGDTVELVASWASHIEGWQRATLVAQLDALFATKGPIRAAPVTELPLLMRQLRAQGYRLGLATNDTEAAARATTARFEIDPYFDFHCGYDSGHGSKPLPGMAHAFCDMVGLSPENIAVVGDNRHDLEMGHAAGAGLIVGVLTGTSAHDDLAPRADAVIESIAELPALLAQRRM